MLDKEVQKKANRRNIFKLVISQFLINLGDVLINPKVTLPWLLQSLGAPLYLLGWLVPIRESGSLLPQLIIAHFIYKVKVRKWVWVLGKPNSISMCGGDRVRRFVARRSKRRLGNYCCINSI